MKSKITCCFCGKESYKENSSIMRAKKDNLPMFCDRKCSSSNKKTSKAEKVELKRLYDEEYRLKNKDSLKVSKAEYNKRTYDPVKAAVKRKGTMWRHVEYCRTPEYREKKKEYDRVYTAKKDYGELWEIQLLTLDIKDEVLSRMTRYQIDLESNTLNKKLRRTRNEQRTNSEEFKRSTLGHIDQR